MNSDCLPIWSQYVSGGFIPENVLPREILKSWQRCRDHGVDYQNMPEFFCLSEEDLETKKETQSCLITLLNDINGPWQRVAEAECIYFLADKACNITFVGGSAETVSRARSIGLAEGYCWQEELIGTNAINLAISLDKPVSVKGAEHYCSFLHGWVFAATPVKDFGATTVAIVGIAMPNPGSAPLLNALSLLASRYLEGQCLLKKENVDLATINHYIVETTKRAILTIDREGRITSFNRMAEKVSGLTKNNVMGKPVGEILSDNDKSREAEFPCSLQETLSTGIEFEEKESMVRFPGKKLPALVSTRLFTNEHGDILGVIGTINDISEAKKMEKRLASAHRELKSLGSIDGLTKLYNHKYFHESLEDEIVKAETRNQPLSLIMVDIDYFKHYNDTFGYPAGDRLLCELARILKNNTRHRDVAARYGGEEFAIILPGTDTSEAMEIAEKLRLAVELYPFAGREEQPRGKLTVSIGVGTYPQNAANKEELLKVVEEALYRAKNSSASKIALYFSVFDDLKSELKQSDLSLLNTIRTLITVINAKDRYTYGHSERVVRYSTSIAEMLSLGPDEVKYIKWGAYLHDIGKIEISRSVLNKKEPLTNEEWRLLRFHPQWGAEIVNPIKALKPTLIQIKHHHERFDGAGYPSGMKGNNIPLSARVLAVADAFDAMTTSRPYKGAKTFDEAFEELKICSGTQFDPMVVEAFLAVADKFRPEKAQVS